MSWLLVGIAAVVLFFYLLAWALCRAGAQSAAPSQMVRMPSGYQVRPPDSDCKAILDEVGEDVERGVFR